MSTTVPGGWPPSPANDPGIRKVLPASYIVYLDPYDNKYHAAADGTLGQPGTDIVNSNAATVLTSAITALAVTGGDIFVKAANYSNPTVSLVSGVTMILEAGVTNLNPTVVAGSNLINMATLGSASADGKVYVDSSDTVRNFLTSKLVAGSNMTFSTLNAGGNEQLSIAAATASSDGKAFVDASDTTRNFLASKLVAGSNITFTTLNPAGNEQISIAAAAASSDHKLNVDASDTTPNYLSPKLAAGTNISLTVLNSGGNEQVQITNTASPTGVPNVVYVHTLGTGGGTAGNPWIGWESSLASQAVPLVAIFVPGYFQVNSNPSTITFGSSNVTLLGYGPASRVVMTNFGEGFKFNGVSSGGQLSNFYIEGLHIIGANLDSGGSSSNPQKGIYFKSCTKFWVVNCWIEQFGSLTLGNQNDPESTGVGLYLGDACQDWHIIGVRSEKNHLQGISVTGINTETAITVGASPFQYQNADSQDEAVFISGGTVSDISILSWNGSTNNSAVSTGLTSGKFWLKNNDKIQVTYSATPSMSKLLSYNWNSDGVIANVNLSNNGHSGLHIENECRNISVTNLTANNCTRDGILLENATSGRVFNEGHCPENIVVDNVVIRDAQRSPSTWSGRAGGFGIDLLGAQDCTFSNINIFFTQGAQGASDRSIGTGFRFWSNSGGTIVTRRCTLKDFNIGYSDADGIHFENSGGANPPSDNTVRDGHLFLNGIVSGGYGIGFTTPVTSNYPNTRIENVDGYQNKTGMFDGTVITNGVIRNLRGYNPSPVATGQLAQATTKAGTPSDSDFVNPQDGLIVVDSTGTKLWVRVGGAWKGVAVA